jgi:hypothetical protein
MRTRGTKEERKILALKERDHFEAVRVCVNIIHLVQGMVQWKTLVNIIMSFRGLQ